MARSKRKRSPESQCISRYVRKGKAQRQAIAICLSSARKGKLTAGGTIKRSTKKR